MPKSCSLLGGMNFAPGTEEYDNLIGSFAPAYGRLANRKGLLDAWVAVGHSETEGSTHPRAKARIDHCLISADLADRVSDVWVDKEATGSDHLPLGIKSRWHESTNSSTTKTKRSSIIANHGDLRLLSAERGVPPR